MALSLMGRAAALYVGKKAVAQTLSKAEQKFVEKLIAARKDPVDFVIGKGIKVKMTPGTDAGDVLIRIGGEASNVSVPATVHENGKYDIHWNRATGKGAKDLLKEINAKENLKTGVDFLVTFAKKNLPTDSKKAETKSDTDTSVNID